MYHILLFPGGLPRSPFLLSLPLPLSLKDACTHTEPLSNSKLAGATELTLTDTYFLAHQSSQKALIAH